MIRREPIDANEAAERCRKAGLKATPQRLAVYRALLAADDHPSPEALFRAVKDELPSISLATIYKTLDSLQAAGLVNEVSLLSESKRYDGNQSPHHHLVCQRCKRVIDHTDPTLDGLLPKDALGGFLPLEVRVQIVGICDACRHESHDDGRPSAAAPHEEEEEHP